MKLIIAYFLLFNLLVEIVNAQNVGINTNTPNASAQLDITATTKGLLIPRINIGNVKLASPVSSPAEGLLVYNTNASATGGEGKGFYYWDGIAWQNLKIAANTWNTVGNIGSSSPLPLLGTLNNTPLVMIFNGLRAMSVDSFNTNLGFRSANNNNTGKYNVAIGRNALGLNETAGKLVAVGDSALYNNGVGALDATEGSFNTATGYKTLFSNNRGYNNTAMGYTALLRTTTGYDNTAIGSFALASNSTGNDNVVIGSISMLACGPNVNRCVAIGAKTLLYNKRDDQMAIGDSALFYNTIFVTDINKGLFNMAIGNNALLENRGGSRNLALGLKSLENNLEGNNNISIGHFSGQVNRGSGNIFIGTEAASTVDVSNKLYIENSSADSSNALLFGDFAADYLNLNARVTVRDFTRLGTAASGAPAVKMKKIVIPAGPAAGGVLNVPFGGGITDNKVLSANALLTYSGTSKIPPAYIDIPGYEYNIQVQFNGITIINKTGNSANIAGKPITVLVTYEE